MFYTEIDNLNKCMHKRELSKHLSFLSVYRHLSIVINNGRNCLINNTIIAHTRHSESKV